MNIPKFLTDHNARKFWYVHADKLERQGLLTESNLYMFCLWCEVWGELRRLNKEDAKSRIYFIALLKQFQSLSRQFKTDGEGKDISEILAALDAE